MLSSIQTQSCHREGKRLYSVKSFKVVCAADIHGSSLALAKVSGTARDAGADLVIIAGDIVLHQIYNGFIDLLYKAARHANCPIFAVAGNHDYWKAEKHFPENQLYIGGKKEVTKKSVVILHDCSIRYRGIKFWGSPWTAKYGNWNWQVPNDELSFSPPRDTNVLITHSPGFGYGDRTADGRRIGSEALTETIANLRHLMLHVFGHNHHDGGWKGQMNNATLINAACHTEDMLFQPRGIVVTDIPLQQ